MTLVGVVMIHEQFLLEKDFIMQNGLRTYIGPERRSERRNFGQYGDLERLMRDFGLERRYMPDRRAQNTSWLLLSRKTEAPRPFP